MRRFGAALLIVLVLGCESTPQVASSGVERLREGMTRAEVDVHVGHACPNVLGSDPARGDQYLCYDDDQILEMKDGRLHGLILHRDVGEGRQEFSTFKFSGVKLVWVSTEER